MQYSLFELQSVDLFATFLTVDGELVRLYCQSTDRLGEVVSWRCQPLPKEENDSVVLLMQTAGIKKEREDAK